MNNSSRIAIALVAALLASPTRAAVVDDTVATVNGEAILLSDFRSEYATKLRQSGQEDTDKRLKAQTLDGMIDRIVLSQAAAQEGVKVLGREVDEAMAQLKSGFTTDENGRSLTEEEAQRAFEAELKAEGIDYPRFRDRIRKELAGRKLIEREVQTRVRLLAEPPRFESFESKLARIMSQRAYQKEARRYVEELRRKAEIVVEK